MRAGAIDFLEKPVAEAKLFAAIRKAIERTRVAKSQREELAAIENKYQLLTPREREVSHLSRRGCSTNKSPLNWAPASVPSKRIGGG